MKKIKNLFPTFIIVNFIFVISSTILLTSCTKPYSTKKTTSVSPEKSYPSRLPASEVVPEEPSSTKAVEAWTSEGESFSAAVGAWASTREPSVTKAVGAWTSAGKPSSTKAADVWESASTWEKARETTLKKWKYARREARESYLEMHVANEKAENGDETETTDYSNNRRKQWDEYLKRLKNASYTFNPPSPIKVDKPRTIHLWVDTIINHEELAEQLKKLVPQDADRIESGEIKIAPRMKASLTGENFKITPVPAGTEVQDINFSGRTIWSWNIVPTWPGTQTLQLRLIAIPPKSIGEPYTIPEALDREIVVEVTIWWAFDHFFEKYWKWLLGGLGTLLVTILGWWWKKTYGNKAN